MATVVLDDVPVIAAWLEQRRALGQDGRDEVWEGDYHVVPHEHARNGNLAMQLVVLLAPAVRAVGLHPGGLFNLGEPGDYRIPDLGYHRTRDFSDFMASAALVVEVLSPRDETFKKFDFYAAHGVDELWVVDPGTHSVRIWVRRGADYDETGSSGLLGVTAHAVSADLDWS